MTALDEKRFLTRDSPERGAIEIAETCPKIPALVAYTTRCGKPTCRCTRGLLHPTQYLRWREGSVQRRRYVWAADVPAVRAILEKRREQRRADRLAFSLSLRSWRELRQWVVEVEARLRAEEQHP